MLGSRVGGETSLIEHEKRVSGALRIGEEFSSDVLKEFAKRGDALVSDPRAAPVLKIGEVHVRRDVLSAWIVINGGSLEALLEEIGADTATGAAMVEVFGSGAVVDGEHATGFPKGQPFTQVATVGIVDFDRLPDGMVIEKPG